MDVSRMDGRVVLVTGAGGGIGRATALLCAQRGASLAICDANETAAGSTAEAARALGAKVLARRVDVSDRGMMNAFADSVHDRFEAVDLLVNNAGIAVVAGFLETTLEDWDRVVGVNLMGVVHGCALFVPRMVECGRDGHVVNVSSAAGFYANPTLAAYSTTKFALMGLSEVMREQLRAQGIGVTAVCPGIINTGIARTSPIRGAEADERRARMTELYERRGYTPEKVAVRILRAVGRNLAVAPITREAHAAYVLTRAAPPLARWRSHRRAKGAQ